MLPVGRASWPPTPSASPPTTARGLTVTGGLPYFGGPGNNYTTHAIATLTDLLREEPAAGTRLGLTTGLGWFVTKHALGVYGSTPPPGGFHRGDTTAAQAAIDASAVDGGRGGRPEHGHRGGGHRLAGRRRGTAAGAPVIARLADGRQMALAPADDEVTRGHGRPRRPRTGRGHRGRPARSEPRYRLAER